MSQRLLSAEGWLGGKSGLTGRVSARSPVRHMAKGPRSQRLSVARTLGSATKQANNWQKPQFSHQKRGKKEKKEVHTQIVSPNSTFTKASMGRSGTTFSNVVNHETIVRGWPITAILRIHAITLWTFDPPIMHIDCSPHQPPGMGLSYAHTKCNPVGYRQHVKMVIKQV